MKMPRRFVDPIEGHFSFAAGEPTGWVNVLYEFSPERYANVEALADADERADPNAALRRRQPVRLLSVNPNEDAVMLFPRTTLPGDHFLKPKYRSIETIILEGFGFDFPEAPDDVAGVLESLPSGFVQDPEYGLGLLKDYRFIIDAIERIPGLERFQLSRTQPTKILGDTYILNFRQYDGLRKAINSTHSNAVKKAADDKHILAYNSLLHELDSSKYPEQHRTYTGGTIYRVVEGGASPKLSEKDQLAVLMLVTQSKKNLGKSHPDKLMRLQREIELVTLEQLIQAMESLISKSVLEPHWQRFFVANPFVLSLAFGLPIVGVGDQVSVGGRTFSGGGEKIADFLIKNSLTDNLALIEIKTPHTKLIGKEYRGGVFPPSRDLAGCVTQVLDQRHHLQADLNALKDNSRQYGVQSYAIRCVVIIGTTPEEPDQKKSLELFRNNLHDVLVITFDELLEKLRQLHKFLSSDADA